LTEAPKKAVFRDAAAFAMKAAMVTDAFILAFARISGPRRPA
jgi:hypothetical protein